MHRTLARSARLSVLRSNQNVSSRVLLSSPRRRISTLPAEPLAAPPLKEILHTTREQHATRPEERLAEIQSHRLDLFQSGALASDSAMEAPAEEVTVQLEGTFMGSQDLNPGDYVELRTSTGGLEDAIVLQALPTRDFVAAISTGEIATFPPRRISFRIPSLFNAKTAETAYTTDPVELNSDRVRKAKVELVKAMRVFRKDLEHAAHEVRRVALTPLYQRFRGSDGRWSAVTVPQALAVVKEVLGSASKRYSENVLRVASYRLMMESSELFVLDSAIDDRFFVAPSSVVLNIRQVNDWVRKKDPRIDAFVARSKVVMAELQTRRKESVDDNHFTTTPLSSHTFSADDITILTYLYNSFTMTRFVQHNSYQAGTWAIGRAFGRDMEESTVDVAPYILRELGVIAPWENHGIFNPIVTEWMDRPHNQDYGGKLPSPPPDGSVSTFGDGVDGLRHDWGDLPAYVIDDITAQELDDAISVERDTDGSGSRWVHAHIADPTALLRPDDPIARTARKYGTTIYHVKETRPMLPPSFTSLFSLREGQTQPVVTFSAKIAEDGSIIDTRVRFGLLRNARVLQYDGVDAALGMDPEPLPLLDVLQQNKSNLPKLNPVSADAKEDLQLLEDVAFRLHMQRVKKGGWTPGFHTSPDISIRPRSLPSLPFPPSSPVHYTGFPSISASPPSSPFYLRGKSSQFLAEFMLMAAQVAGRHGLQYKAPLIHRTVTSSNFSELCTRWGDPETGKVPWKAELLQLRTVKANTVTPGSHDLLGLGGDPFVRVTSPLRRFTDMVNHWQLKASLSPAAPRLSVSELEAISKEMETCESDEAGRDAKDKKHWAGLLMEQALSKAPEHFRGLNAQVLNEPRRALGQEWVVPIWVPDIMQRSFVTGLTYAQASQLKVENWVKVDMTHIVRFDTVAPRFNLSSKAQ